MFGSSAIERQKFLTSQNPRGSYNSTCPCCCSCWFRTWMVKTVRLARLDSPPALTRCRAPPDSRPRPGWYRSGPTAPTLWREFGDSTQIRHCFSTLYLSFCHSLFVTHSYTHTCRAGNRKLQYCYSVFCPPDAVRRAAPCWAERHSHILPRICSFFPLFICPLFCSFCRCSKDYFTQ